MESRPGRSFLNAPNLVLGKRMLTPVSPVMKSHDVIALSKYDYDAWSSCLSGDRSARGPVRGRSALVQGFCYQGYLRPYLELAKYKIDEGYANSF